MPACIDWLARTQLLGTYVAIEYTHVALTCSFTEIYSCA